MLKLILEHENSIVSIFSAFRKTAYIETEIKRKNISYSATYLHIAAMRLSIRIIYMCPHEIIVHFNGRCHV